MPEVALSVTCERMSPTTRGDALELLAPFLTEDVHYLASSTVYGDGGRAAIERAVDLFIARPELGFVWLARAHDPAAVTGHSAVGGCVVCYAISTSRGALVAKLDDVSVRTGWQGRGIGTAMLQALVHELRHGGVTRIDTACHRDNAPARRFYERLGFESLHEERIALLL